MQIQELGLDSSKTDTRKEINIKQFRAAPFPLELSLLSIGQERQSTITAQPPRSEPCSVPWDTSDVTSQRHRPLVLIREKAFKYPFLFYLDCVGLVQEETQRKSLFRQ